VRPARLVLALALACVSQGVWPHELVENKVTLVLRDERHVSLSFFIRLPQAMHLALEPHTPYTPWVLRYAAATSAQCQALLSRAQAVLQPDVRVQVPGQKDLRLSAWRWPSPAQLQAVFQQITMQTLTGDPDGAHEPLSEFSAEATADAPIRSLNVSMPEAFGRVLLVSYQPRQAWANPRQPLTRIEFH